MPGRGYVYLVTWTKYKKFNLHIILKAVPYMAVQTDVSPTMLQLQMSKHESGFLFLEIRIRIMSQYCPL